MRNLVNSKAYPWALVGIFGALHLVMTFIPYSVLGTGGGFITWGMISAPVVGFLLGPIYGGIAVFIGSIIGTGIFNLGGFLGPIVPIIAPTTCAIAVGSFREMKMWMSPLLLAIAIILFLFSPIGAETIIYVWLYVILFVINIIFVIPKLGGKFYSLLDLRPDLVQPLTALSLYLVMLSGLIVDSAVGSTVTVYYLVYVGAMDPSVVSAMYLPITFVYPIERLLGALIASLIVSTVSISTLHMGLELPLGSSDESELLELELDEDS